MDNGSNKANGAKRPGFGVANGFKRPTLVPPQDHNDDEVNISIINIYGSGPLPILRRPDTEDDVK